MLQFFYSVKNNNEITNKTNGYVEIKDIIKLNAFA